MTHDELMKAVIDGDVPRAEALTREALDRGSDPEQILDDRLVAAMDVVGQRFSTGEMYVPEMLVAARAMKACIAIIRPFLADKKHKSRGTVVIGTVKGDIHDVGKNLVSIMLEGAGFEILDLGVDVAPDAFVQAVDEHSPDIVALSSLLTTTMPGLRDVINALQASGVRDKVKVMVGGAPVTDEFARAIGADGYAPDAGAASEAAGRLVAAAASDRED